MNIILKYIYNRLSGRINECEIKDYRSYICISFFLYFIFVLLLNDYFIDILMFTIVIFSVARITQYETV